MINNELQKEWKQRFLDYQHSGLSIVAWCREQSLPVSRFYYWRRRLNLKPKPNNAAVKWLPIDVKPSFDPKFVMIHVGQISVEVQDGFDHELLGQVVKVLKTL
jgi:hypothetical protein